MYIYFRNVPSLSIRFPRKLMGGSESILQVNSVPSMDIIIISLYDGTIFYNEKHTVFWAIMCRMFFQIEFREGNEFWSFPFVTLDWESKWLFCRYKNRYKNRYTSPWNLFDLGYKKGQTHCIEIATLISSISRSVWVSSSYPRPANAISSSWTWYDQRSLCVR